MESKMELRIKAPQSQEKKTPAIWYEAETSLFLDLLQAHDVLEDICASRTKQALCNVAQRLCDAGFNKTWDHCRIKLKNMKAQHRMILSQFPNVFDTNVESNDDVLKQHIINDYHYSQLNIQQMKSLHQFLDKCTLIKANIIDEKEDPIGSPPPEVVSIEEPIAKKVKKEEEETTDFNQLLSGNLDDGHKYLEKFNKDMMDQFMEYQKRYSDSYVKWKQERYRQEQKALEQWHKESREHEKQMLGVFCSTVAHCNSALSALMKAKQEAQDELKSLKLLMEGGDAAGDGLQTTNKDKDSDPPELILSDD